MRIVIFPIVDAPVGTPFHGAGRTGNGNRLSADAGADTDEAAPSEAAPSDDDDDESGSGLGERGTGPGRGLGGDLAHSGSGSGQGRQGGFRTGSTDPSWHDNHSAELATEHGGRTPADGGKKGGSASGEVGGAGNTVGLGLWGGLLDASEAVAPLVTAGLILADANFIHFGEKFLSRVVRGMATDALRKELSREATQVVAREMVKVRDRLARSPAFRNLPAGEQKAMLESTEKAMERTYYKKAGAFFEQESRRSDTIAAKYKTDTAGKHIHKLTTENAAAYRKMAKSADEVRAALPPPRIASTESRLLETGKSARKLRLEPGKATGGQDLVRGNSQWLRGTSENAALLPKQVADALRGKTFQNWDEFRTAVWRTIADDETLRYPFNADNIRRMRNGWAPKVDPSQQLGKLDSYVLHHITPIPHGGGVYDLDYIWIVTPRYHKEALDKSYHYNKGKQG